MNTFNLLNEKIQKVIYKMGWKNFRPIQDEAIIHLTSKTNDLIIEAPTASGKTEACFLPIISNIAKNNNVGVKILYISPLKALINDQFYRIEKMCAELKIPIVKWHGDVAFSSKQKLLKSPDGILLITPESIEALFVNRYRQIASLFNNLEYIVIDEVHSFISTPRGNHLFSLLNRIELEIKKRPIRIALSATLGKSDTTKKWLNYKNPNSVFVISSNDSINIGLKGIINAYKTSESSSLLLKDLLNTIKINKNLIFEDSKNKAEEHCVAIKELAKKENITGRFFIHHGALSKEIREITEMKLKKQNDISVFCTSTLELGIDIGDIDKIVFLDPPKSVSSAIQRLGRSGRKENTNRNFAMFIEELANDGKIAHTDKLRINLIQSIAIIELLARDKWCESLKFRFDYSTIIHQILSFITSIGGAQIDSIFDFVIVKGFENAISKEIFLEIIKSLRDKKIIYSMKNQNISLTDIGEALVSNYKFYPAFLSNDDYEVSSNGNIIGFINAEKLAISVGDNIIMAGKQWLVQNILIANKKILVLKSNGGKSVFVTDGEFIINRKILLKMQEIYEQKITNIFYLNDTAKLMLQEGIDEYKSCSNKFLLIFGGTKVQNTLNFLFSRVLKEEDLDLLEDLEIGFYHFKGLEFLLNSIRNIEISKKTFIYFFSNIEEKNIVKLNKFDYLLSKELLVDEYIENNFDVEETSRIIAVLLKA